MKRRVAAKPVVAVKPGVEAKSDSLVAPEVVEKARHVLGLERPTAARCVVCGDQASVDATERLCWVCRRLKISAWRDADHQLPAQE